MQIKIYQSYFDEKGKSSLDPSFIPYDVSDNKNPELREYPLLKKLVEQNKEYDGYWGMASWRWYEKTKISGRLFLDWAQSQEGADFYHINHDQHSPRKYNMFQHGAANHPRMMDVFSELSNTLGLGLDLNGKYPKEYFITCHYYVTTNAVWTRMMYFMDQCVDTFNTNERLHNLVYETAANYRGLNNFPFVIERLPSLFLLLNSDITVKEYPLQPVHLPSVLLR